MNLHSLPINCSKGVLEFLQHYFCTIRPPYLRAAFLFFAFCCAQGMSAQQDKTPAALHQALKEAVAAGDAEKAEALKKELKALEEKNALIKELEEDKQILIFQRKYDEVPAIEQRIAEAKAAPAIAPVAPPAVAVAPAAFDPQKAMHYIPLSAPAVAPSSSRAKAPKGKAARPPRKPLLEYEFNDKAIVSLGGGLNVTPDPYFGLYNEYFIAHTYTKLRWWVNKYVVFGPSHEFSTLDYIDDTRMQSTINCAFLANFTPYLLPYTSLGTGVGVGIFESPNGYWENRAYVPLNVRLGSYLFFSKSQAFGFYFEFNRELNENVFNEKVPMYRAGFCWSKVKVRAKRRYEDAWRASQLQ